MSQKPTYEELEQRVLELEGAEPYINITETLTFQQFEKHNAICLLIEPDSGVIINANTAAQNYYGYSLKTLKKMKIREINMLSLDEIVEKRQQAVTEKVNCFEFPHRLSSGEIRTVEVQSLPVVLNDKKLLLSIIHDITDRKQAEKALRESDQRYRRLAENSPDMLYRMSLPDGKYEYVSPAAEKIFGYPPEDWYSNSVLIQKIIHPDFYSYFNEQWESLNNGVVPPVYEYKITHKDTNERWINQRNFLVNDAHGKPIALEAIATDITERIKAEEAIRKGEERFRGIVESMSDWVWEVDSEGRFTYCSEKVESILGYTPEEMIGKTPFDFMTPDEVEKIGEIYGKIMTEKGSIQNLENWNLSKDGRQICLLTNGVPILDKSGGLLGFHGVDSDITERIQMRKALEEANNLLNQRVTEKTAQLIIEIEERKQADKSLRESEERYREYFEENISGTYISTPEGNLIACNREYRRIFGFDSIEHALETPINNFFKNPNERAEFLNVIKKEKRVTGYEPKLMRLDEAPFHLIENASGVFDKDGNLEHIRGFLLDVTEQKKLESQLKQSQKMEAIGNLAGGIAHDFNNILSGIFGFSQLAKRHLADPERAQKDIDQIIKGAQKATDLVQQILTVSRKSTHEKQPVPVYIIVKEALKLLRATIPSTIEIEKDIVSKATVMAEPDKMHQIIMNLCTNSYHAMNETGGRMVVRLKEIVFSQTECLPELNLVPGQYLDLEVSDTGIGMDSTILKKIFDPYFTTKEHGKGTGLGLALVFGIVKEFKGDITVHSELGQGSTFHIYLPIIDKPVATFVPKKEDKITLSGEETIMVVDDEESLRNVAYDLLQGLGYTVHTFSNGIEAFEAYKEDPYRFDLVVTDMTMPGMTGLELSQKILKLRHEQPVMLCTGYSESINREKVVSMGISEYFEKPIITKELAKVIRALLDEAKSNSCA